MDILNSLLAFENLSLNSLIMTSSKGEGDGCHVQYSGDANCFYFSLFLFLPRLHTGTNYKEVRLVG